MLTECTADLAFMLITNACRRGQEYDAIMCAPAGARAANRRMLGIRLAGEGSASSVLASAPSTQRARGFGMKVLYSARRARRLPAGLEQGADYFDFHAMLPH